MADSRKLLERFDPETRDAVDLLQTVGKGLLVDLQVAIIASDNEENVWNGLNMIQRVILKLILPPIKGKSLKHKETDQETRARAGKPLGRGNQKKPSPPSISSIFSSF